MANNIIRYPLPLLGLNTVNPYIEHDSGYARELTNFIIKNGRIFMRPAISSYSFNQTIVDSLARIWWFDPNSATRMSILSDGSRVNYTTGAVAEAAGVFQRHAQPTELKFSGTATTLDMVFGLYRPLVIDGGTAVAPDNLRPLTKASTFAATGPYAAFGRPYCGASHKGRLYYANATYTIEWGNVGQVAGAFPAANTLSLEQFMNGQNISRLFSISLSPGAAPSQNLFVVFGDAGRVLVFEGDNPGSATWNLIGAYDMPRPVSRRAFVEIDGDIFIAGDRYAYWFKDLFNSGAQAAYETSPTRPIENLWQAVTWVFLPLSDEESHVFYDSANDAIVCQCFEKNTSAANLSDVFEYNNEAVYFAYFRKYKAWSLWAAAPFFSPVITSGDIVCATAYRGFITRLADAGSQDVYLPSGAPFTFSTRDIETSWKTPYAFLEKGVGMMMSSARAWVELLHSDGYASIEKSRAIFNFSDLNAPWGFYTQSMVSQINPGRYNECRTTMNRLTYNQYQPLLQLGGDGSCLSLQTTFKGQVPDPGYTDPFIYSIYGISALVQPASEIF